MIHLFVPQFLLQGERLSLDSFQVHYLIHVMRLNTGDEIAVFNGKDGLWRAQLEGRKNRWILIVFELLLPQSSDCWAIHLYFSLVKRGPWILEKGSELGVTHFHPLLSERSVIRQWNEEKAMKTILEACEQSGRLTVPQILPLDHLKNCVSSIRQPFYVANISAENDPFTFSQAPEVLHVFVGPEGGWSEPEKELFQNHKFCRFINLGDNVLRSETAAVASIVYLKTLAGCARRDSNSRHQD